MLTLRDRSRESPEAIVHVFSRSLRSENAGFPTSRRVIARMKLETRSGDPTSEAGRLGPPQA